MNHTSKQVKRRRKIYCCSSYENFPKRRYNTPNLNLFNQAYNNIYSLNRNNYKLTCSCPIEQNPYSQIPDRGYGIQNDTIIFKSISPKGKMSSQDFEKFRLSQMDSFDSTEYTGLKNYNYKNETENFNYSMPIGYRNPILNSPKICTCSYIPVSNICTCNSCDFYNTQKICTCDKRRLFNSFSCDNIKNKKCTCEKKIIYDNENNLYSNENLKMQGVGLNVLVENSQNLNQQILENEDISYLKKSNNDNKELIMQNVNDLYIEPTENEETIQILIPLPENEIDQLGGFFIEATEENSGYDEQEIKLVKNFSERKINIMCPENVDNLNISHEYSTHNYNVEYLNKNLGESSEGFVLQGVKKDKEYSVEHNDLSCESINNNNKNKNIEQKIYNKNDYQKISNEKEVINKKIITTDNYNNKKILPESEVINKKIKTTNYFNNQKILPEEEITNKKIITTNYYNNQKILPEEEIINKNIITTNKYNDQNILNEEEIINKNIITTNKYNDQNILPQNGIENKEIIKTNEYNYQKTFPESDFINKKIKTTTENNYQGTLPRKEIKETITINENNIHKILPEKEIINNEIITTNNKKSTYIIDEKKKIITDKYLDTNSNESITNDLYNNSTKIQSKHLSNYSSSRQSKINIKGVSNPIEEWHLKTQRVLVLSFKGIPKQKITNQKNIYENYIYNDNNINKNPDTIINDINENHEVILKTKITKPQKKNWNIFNINQRGIELEFSKKNNWNLGISQPNNFSFKKENEYENNNEEIILNNDYNTLREDHLRMRSIHATILKVHDDDSRSSVSSYDFLQYVKTKNMIGINESQNFYESEVNKEDKNYIDNQKLKISENYISNGNDIKEKKEKREEIIAIFEKEKKPDVVFNNMFERKNITTKQMPIDIKNTNINDEHYQEQIKNVGIEINKGVNNFDNEYIINNENNQQRGNIEINEMHDYEINKNNYILNGKENKKIIEVNKEINVNNVGNENKIEDDKNIINLNKQHEFVSNEKFVIEANENQISNQSNELNINIENQKNNQRNIIEEVTIKTSKKETNVKEYPIKNEPEKQKIIENEGQKIMQQKIEENKKINEIEQQKKTEKEKITIAQKIEYPVENKNEKEVNVLLFNKRSKSPDSKIISDFNSRSKIEIKNVVYRNPSADSKEIRKVLNKGGKMKKFEYLREEPCESNIWKY